MDLHQRPTFHENHREWLRRFREAEIAEPEKSADSILAYFFNYNEFSMIPNKMMQRLVTDEEISTINKLCSKRFLQMPVEYITGECYFCGINLKMRAPVFIPSVVETAGLVEHVANSILSLINERAADPESKVVRVLDVGCGSGAVTLSLMNILKDKPVEYIAIDATHHAVELMKENVERLGFKNSENLRILEHTLGEDDDVISKFAPFDVIVGNTPYVPSSDMEELDEEIKKYEDLFAYHGGNDGLYLINIILRRAETWLSKNGSTWFEIDPSQPKLMADRYSDYWNVNSYKDVVGVWRYSHLTKK